MAAARPARCSSGLAGWPTIDPNLTLEVGTPDDVLRSGRGARSTRGAPVPVWRGELYFETHRGTLTSQLRTKLGNRRCERLLRRGRAVGGHARARPPTSTSCGARSSPSSSTTSCPGSSIAWVHADAEAVFERRGHRTEARIAGAARATSSHRGHRHAADVVARQPGRRRRRRRRAARRAEFDGGRRRCSRCSPTAASPLGVRVPALGVAPLTSAADGRRSTIGSSCPTRR